MRFGAIVKIVKKELDIEFRQQFAIGGIFLFVATVIYMMYKSFNVIPPREWTVLLWIIVLFAGLNAVVKSFVQERRETYLYYYTLLDPIELAIAKLVYNFVFLMLVFLSAVAVLSVFADCPIKNFGFFFGSSALGVFGIATVFTFVSLMASSGNNNSTLMSVLSLPLVLPILLTMLKTSAVSARLITDTSVNEDVMLLCGMDAIFLGIMIALFPMLWKS
jgi:heme exporter protein B